MKTRMIGLCGPAGAGKDTAADALCSHGWKRIAFADPVREGLAGVNPSIWVPAYGTWWRWFRRAKWHCVPLRDAVATMGWNALKQLPEVRGLLQRYGTEGGRDIHGQDCWITTARRRIKKLRERYGDGVQVVFTDVRFKNEVAFVRESGGIVVRIERNQNDRQLRGPVSRHASEISLCENDWDRLIVNNGTVRELHLSILGMAYDD